MSYVQAYDFMFNKIDYAIYPDDLVVDFSKIETDEDHWKFVKSKLNVRNKLKARCKIGAVVYFSQPQNKSIQRYEI